MTAVANQPVSFTFQESHDVRIEIINNEPWFCLKDVCEVLGLTNNRKVLSSQVDINGVTKSYVIDSMGREQEAAFVNEPNLYRVIFRSNKPEAKQFQDWVFSEVLPTIRKTGSYNALHPHQNVEPLDPNDMANLKYLIMMMTTRFKYKDSWNQGIWFALRRATGTPSPQPFSVEGIPVIAQECRRIIDITSAASNMICQFEKDVLKHVIRNRKDFDAIANKMQNDFQQLQIPVDGMRKLERFEEIGLMRLQNRAH